MKRPPLLLLILWLLFAPPFEASAVTKYVIEKKTGKSVFQKKDQKRWKKAVKSFLLSKIKDPETKREKKKMLFGVKALLFLGLIVGGVLIGSGIGNILIFLGWFFSVLFGLQGVKRDGNKFPALLALAIAGVLLLSTITFLSFD